MAMTPSPRGSDTRGQERLRAAAAMARTEPTDRRWVEIERDVLDRLLTVSRPSHPVVGHDGTRTFHVSEQVLSYHLLGSVDTVANCAADAIGIHTDEQYRCTGITVVVTAEYGHSLLEVADRVREAVQAAVPDLLGTVRPPVSVTDMHVHVHDVSVGDPRRG